MKQYTTSSGIDAPEDEWAEPEASGFLSRVPNPVITLVTALVTLGIVAGIGIGVVNHFLNLINFQAADSDYFATVSTPELLPVESPVSERVAELEEEELANTLEATPEEMAQWDEHIENVVSDSDTYEVPIDQDIYNILLIGSDTREVGEVGRSDAMILVSINRRSESIYLTSFLRDCYVYIPGYGNTRLNQIGRAHV